MGDHKHSDGVTGTVVGNDDRARTGTDAERAASAARATTDATSSVGQPNGRTAPTAFAGGRFERLKALGAGGMGVVYAARDTKHGSRVAIKQLDRVTPRGLYRFKQEFRALANVRHENLVSLYELLSENERWYLSMELVEGVDFMAYVRGVSENDRTTAKDAPPANSLPMPAQAQDAWGTGTKTQDPTEGTSSGVRRRARPLTSPDALVRLARSLAQLTRGLLAIHAQGYVHGDIKPSNVLVTDAGAVKILDFGIVRQLRGGRDETEIAYTPAYAAPEAIIGNATNEATDWYSVGIILYEALTGQLPFEGASADIVKAKLDRGQEAPRVMSDMAPATLVELCHRLLSFDPGRRPSGNEILDTLGERPSEDLEVVTTEMELYGRANELDVLQRAWHLTQGERQPRTLLVHGLSGMGKSALIERFLQQNQTERTIQLGGRCYQHESVPYKALDSAVDALAQQLTRLDEATVKACLPADIAPLARLFPVLGRVRWVRELNEPLQQAVDGHIDPHELRRRAHNAFRELLKRLSAHRAITLHIDDCQWGDRDSAHLLAETFRDADAPPVLLVLAYRTDEADASPFLATVREAMPNQAELAITALSDASTAQLARTLLTARGASLTMVEHIVNEAKGSPLFTAELVRHVVRQHESGTRALELRDVINARVEELPGQARDLLRILSVAGQPIAQDVAFAAAGLGEDAFSIGRDLCVAQLARTHNAAEEELLESFHDRIREAVAQGLSAQERLSSHHAIATALEGAGHVDPERLATHWDAAGETRRASPYYEEAAARAYDALAFNRAVQLYERCIVLANGEARDPQELYEKLGDALANDGRGALSAQAYQDAAQRAKGDVAFDLLARAAGQLLRGGRIDEGLDLLEEVLRDLNAPLPESRLGLLGMVARERLRLKLKGIDKDHALNPDANAADVRRLDLYFRAMGALGFIDPLKGFALQCRYLREALRIGDASHIARALAAEANFQSFGGPKARQACDTVSTRSRALAKASSDPLLLGYTDYSVGLAHYQFGEFKQSYTYMQRAAEHWRGALGAWWETCIAEEGALWCLSYLGETAELSRRVRGLLREAEARGDQYFATNLCMGKPSLHWIAQDNVAESRALTDEMLATWTGRGFQRQHFNALLTHCQADLYEGDHAAALERIESQWQALTKSSVPRVCSMRIEAWHLRARVALATAARGGDTIAQQLKIARLATRKLMKEKTPFAQALVPLQNATLQLLTGNREGGIVQLDKAALALAQADMRLYSECAKRARAALTGDKKAIEAADAWMREQGIANPEKTMRVFAPGVVSGPSATLK